MCHFSALRKPSPNSITNIVKHSRSKHISMAKPYRHGRAHREKIAAKELKDLSPLIRAMSDDYSEELFNLSDDLASGVVAMFDHLDPKKDKCLNKEPWDSSIEGDFNFTRMTPSGHVFVIFGDAHGHFAHASGLRLFVAASLKRIFDRHGDSRVPTALALINDLNNEFLRVGCDALRRNASQPLRGGTNLVVLRIHPGTKTADYASAGIPLMWLTAKGAAHEKGKMLNYDKFLMFPEKAQPKDEGQKTTTLTKGTILLTNIAYFVMFTDGFEGLGRLSSAKSKERPEKLGRSNLIAALTKAFHRPKRTAKKLSQAIVSCAQNWRKGYFVPEQLDDDRLVLVVDLEKFRQRSLRRGDASTSGSPVERYKG